MSRYIDADAIIEFIDLGHYRNPLELCYSEQYVVDMIESRPTADVVDVVRCKDCKHYSADGWGYGNCYRPNVEYLRMADNGFCSRAERREDG